jgi:MFS family permease
MTLVFIALFNSILGLSILFPIIQPLGRQLGLSEIEVGSLSAGYAAMQLLASAYWGRRSERVGRKPVLLTGIIGFSVSFFLFGLVAELGLRGMFSHGVLFGALLASRIVGGGVSSATIPTAQAYVADITDRENRTRGMAVIGAAFGLGIIVGPGIGAGLATFGMLVPVFASAGLAVLNAVWVFWKLPEPERRTTATVGSWRESAGRLWPLLAVALAVSTAAVSMEQTIAFYFQDRLALDAKSTVRSVGIALVAYGVVAVIVQGGIVRRVPWAPRTFLLLGTAITAVGLIGLTQAVSFPQLVVLLATIGVGQGFAMPGITSAISLRASDADQGSAAGLNSSAQALGRFGGPLIGTSLYQLHATWPYFFGAGLLVVAWLASVPKRVFAPGG